MFKRWIPFVSMCLVTAFLAGLSMGSVWEAEHANRSISNRRLNTTIAVVNADAGVEINGHRYNYSAAVIDTLGDDFSLVSPAMAQTGFSNGTFGAVVIFPAEVSSRILSFNAQQPERVQLEFQINQNLPERDYLETHIAISSLQLSINTTLANTYVSSIFRQFHEAQDQIEGVFANNISDYMAMGIITLGDFTHSLELDEIPQIPFNLAELDTQFNFDLVTRFAEDISGWYSHSYDMASEQFLWMREGLFELTEDFPDQQDDWLDMLEEWTSYSYDFGSLLETYSSEVRFHEEALQYWYIENRNWHSYLGSYQQDVASWHEASVSWFETAESWHEEYLNYLDQVREFAESVTSYHDELVDSIIPLMEDISEWKETLEAYEEALFDIFETLLETVEIYNYVSVISNMFLIDLLNLHYDLDGYRYDLTEWKYDVNERQVDLSEWQEGLEYAQEEFEFILDVFFGDNQFLPPIPDRVLYDIDQDEYLAAITPAQALPNFLDLEFPSRIQISETTRNITVPQGPGLIGSINPEDYATLLNTWYLELLYVAGLLGEWREESIAYQERLAKWQYELEYIQESIASFYVDLEHSYLELGDWHSALFDFSFVVSDWNNELILYSEDMAIWHEILESFTEELHLIELPELPDFTDLEFLETPYEIEFGMPEDLEPVEVMQLPSWDEELEAPLPYAGASIIDAFDIDFPLDGSAITEVSDLDHPAEFTGYRIPDVVEGLEWLGSVQPLSPIVGSPPRPDNFWASLGFMHDQLSQFDVGDFLGDSVRAQVDSSLEDYEAFLENLRGDLNFAFGDNIQLLHGIRADYNFYLEGLRLAALATASNEQVALQDAIGEFSSITHGNRENTRYRLNDFASMMPESRQSAGINQSLVDFAVAPFEFTRMEARDEMPFEYQAISTMTSTYQGYFRVATMALIGVFLLTLAGCVLSFLKQRKKTDNITKRRLAAAFAPAAVAAILVIIFAVPVIARAESVNNYSPIQVMINNESHNITPPAKVLQDLMHVPVRGIFEALGASVEWDDDTQRLIVTTPRENVIMLAVAEHYIYINESPYLMESPIQLLDGSMMMHARAIALIQEFDMEWDDYSRVLSFNTSPLIMDAEELVSTLFALTNEARERQGLSPLVWSEELTELAISHSIDMAENNLTGNSGSNGSTVLDRVLYSDLKMVHVSGNAFRLGYAPAEEVFEILIGNRQRENNILNEFAIEGAIAVSYATVRRVGQDSVNIFVVQKFGTPAVTDSLEFDQRIFELVNEARTNDELSLVEWDEDLAAAARKSSTRRIAQDGNRPRSRNLLIERSFTIRPNDISPEFLMRTITRHDTRGTMLGEDVISLGVGLATGLDYDEGYVTNIDAPSFDNDTRQNLQITLIFATEYEIPEAADPFYLSNLLDSGYTNSQIIDMFEREVFRLSNIERTAVGLPPLTWDNTLGAAARMHSIYMSETGVLSHVGPRDSTSSERAEQAGASFDTINENISNRSLTPSNAVERWMLSPSPRGHILHENTTHLGVGFNFNNSLGLEAFITQKFGR